MLPMLSTTLANQPGQKFLLACIPCSFNVLAVSMLPPADARIQWGDTYGQDFSHDAMTQHNAGCFQERMGCGTH